MWAHLTFFSSYDITYGTRALVLPRLHQAWESPETSKGPRAKPDVSRCLSTWQMVRVCGPVISLTSPASHSPQSSPSSPARPSGRALSIDFIGSLYRGVLDVSFWKGMSCKSTDRRLQYGVPWLPVSCTRRHQSLSYVPAGASAPCLNHQSDLSTGDIVLFNVIEFRADTKCRYAELQSSRRSCVSTGQL